jgi:hypothetical protein
VKKVAVLERSPRPLFRRRSRRIPVGKTLLSVTGLAVIGYLGWTVWASSLARIDFDRAVARGTASLAKVERHADEGRSHAGGPVRYRADPPTSGPHATTVTPPGFYLAPQRADTLVHALEHGNIVIYYGTLTPEEARAALEELARRFDGRWDGLVVVPRPEAGAEITLTAWRRALRLREYDPNAVAAFVDAHRGRGPENPVR